MHPIPSHGGWGLAGAARRDREFCIDNLLVRIHFIIVARRDLSHVEFAPDPPLDYDQQNALLVVNLDDGTRAHGRLLYDLEITTPAFLKKDGSTGKICFSGT